MIEITRIDQSPMNPKRWGLTLACGHEIWTSSARKPTLKRVSECVTCRQIARRNTP
jgi:hypothetical protein